MASHDRLVAEIIQKKRTGLRLETIEDQIFLCRAFLHTADLLNPARNFNAARKWSGLLSDEFQSQVDKERSMGLPISSWMEQKGIDIAIDNEIGFIQRTARPLFEAMVALYPSLSHLLHQIDENIEHYKALKLKISEFDQSGNVRAVAFSSY